MRRLVILRPEPGGGQTAKRAAERGLVADVHPLFQPQPLDWTPPAPDRFDALLLTSAHAARLAGPHLADYRGLPAYGVGQATAVALRQAGFADVVAGDGDGSAIAARIADDGHRAVLHLAGLTVAQMEVGPLSVERVAVYAMRRTMDDGLADRLEPGSVVLVHSPRAGEILAEKLGLQRRSALHLIAISPAALVACGPGWASAQAPDSPDDETMLALAARLCE